MAITYFEPGTRVIFRRSPVWLSRSVKGEKGTIKVGSSSDATVLVKLDTPVDNFNNLWLYAKDVEAVKAKQPVIVITSDGKTTTATKRLGKKVICSATARCSDDDTFDFNTGAELAFRRLREKEKPVPKEDPLPEKLVCIWTCVPDFTKGKVYKTTHALNRLFKVWDNDNYSWVLSEKKVGGYYVDSFFEHQAQFIPLVED